MPSHRLLPAAVALALSTSALADGDRGGSRDHRRNNDRVSAAAATSSSSCRNPTWTTVDDFLPPGALKASAGSVLATSSQVLVGGAVFSDANTSNWVVRRTKNTNTWETVDDFFSSQGVSAHVSEIVRNVDTLFAVGGANVPGSNTGPWLVRSSKNNNNWAVSDQFVDDQLPAANALTAVADANDHVLVGGYEAQSGDRTYHWIVRETADSGATWTISDDHPPIRNATGVQGLGLNPLNGDVYAVGYDFDGTQYNWLTRKRSGGIWTTVDTFLGTTTPASTVGSAGGAVTGTTSGTVVVVGGGRDANNGSHWVVRRSTNNGASWATVDDIGGNGQVCGGSGITFDATDRTLYAVGRCRASTGNYHWLVRVSFNDGVTWSTEDDFVFAGGQDSMPGGVGASPNGLIIVAGVARAADTVPHWIVRRRLCH